MSKLIRKRQRRQNIKKVSKCEHIDAPYYSKGLCTNCYHRFGRVKKATACEHHERKLYARQVCKGCYLRIYHRGKKLPIILQEISVDHPVLL